MAGSNPSLDASIRLRPELLDFLRQDQTATCPLEETLARLDRLGTKMDPAAPAQAALPAVPVRKADRKP